MPEVQQQPLPDETYFFYPDLAQEMRVSVKTVYRLVKAGVLPRPHRIGNRGRWRWFAADIRKFQLKLRQKTGHTLETETRR